MITINLKNKLKIVSGIIAINLIALGWATFQHLSAVDDISQAHNNRYESYKLADELRQSSDDLTRLARTYVATLDGKYEKQYFDILDIRDGKKPRPQQYHRIYWDFLAAHPEKPRPDDEAKALLTLMREAGFTDKEFAKLEEAKKNSDGLVKTEVIAMNAVKGQFDDGKGGFTLKKEPDQMLAIRLMNSPEYHRYKAEIMRPIDAFYVEMESRLDRRLADVLDQEQRSKVILVGSVALLTLSLVGLLFDLARRVFRPLFKMHAAIDQLAHEDFDLPSDIAHDRDEIGTMGTSILRFRDGLANARILRDRLQQENTERSEKVEAIELAIDGFSVRIEETFQALGLSTGKLEQTARTMEEAATTTRRQSERLDDSSASTLSSTQSVASATEELSSSIHEISRQVQESSGIASQATAEADRTADQVRQLAEAATRIGDVVRLINEIATQTNLLALNATIEAARAGDAGKGFAVVASEVKNLATQTAKATEEIASQVQAVQGETTTVVRSIKVIGDTISRMNEITTSVASAVEQQGNATAEIARNVQQASDGTLGVTQSIEVVRRSADNAGAASTEVLGAVTDLTRQGAALRQEVATFLGKIRAA
ncbi:methyl-accepting chemotaxis protein [Lacibacterium aquatile]|uniref:Methyl-accepting chemotaxis protein n=1 Tax=Lacibacterium aquatile TaxID=1168082 RepID=A0ABW5DR85_9PROT